MEGLKMAKEPNHEFDFDFTKLKEVDISEVQPNAWNPKNKDTKEYKQVVRSIATNGLRQPIVVREVDGHYEIIDGEQRFTAAKELGYKKVFVYNEGEMPEKQAKALTIWYEVQVPFNEVDLSHLVVELNNLAVELPYTEAEIKDFENMAKFSFDDYGDGEGEGGDEGAPNLKTLTVKMIEPQYDVVMDAINHVKEENDCNDARALELICAEYMSGVEL